MRSFALAIVAAVVGMATVFLAIARAEAPAKPAKRVQPAKTIEEITIEGEVRLPEVLFITSRDVQRPIDWLEEYLLEEEAARLRLDQAPVRLLLFPDAPPAQDVDLDESFAPEREIQEESR